MALIILADSEDYDLCIKGWKRNGASNTSLIGQTVLSQILDQSSIKDNVQCEVHQMQSDDGEHCDLYLHIKFDGDRDVTDLTRPIVSEFCTTFWMPEHTDALLDISKYGILGFSAGHSTFGAVWNLIAVSFAVRQGQQLWVKTTPADFQRSQWPIWLNVAAVAVVEGVEECFQFDPGLLGISPQSLIKCINMLEQANGFLSGEADNPMVQSIAQMFKQWASPDVASKSKEEIARDLRIALYTFFDLSGTLLEHIDELTAPNRGDISLADQFQIGQDLLQIFHGCSQIWTSSEKLVRMHQSYAVSDGVKTSVKSAAAVLAGRTSVAALRAASLNKAAAIKVLENVPVEGVATKLGRTLGLMATQTPQQAAVAQASMFTSAAKQLTARAAMGGAFTLYLTYSAATSSLSMMQNFWKSETFRKLHRHAINVAYIALQARTTLTWIANTGGNVEFVGDATSAWEAYLRQKYGKEVLDKHFAPEFVKRELKQCVDDLRALDEELKKEVMAADLSGLA